MLITTRTVATLQTITATVLLTQLEEGLVKNENQKADERQPHLSLTVTGMSALHTENTTEQYRQIT